jgi:hypothetical protein
MVNTVVSTNGIRNAVQALRSDLNIGAVEEMMLPAKKQSGISIT